MKSIYRTVTGLLASTVFAGAITISIWACSEFIEVDAPKTQIVPETVFETGSSASSALRGIYSLMMTNTSFTRGGMEEYLGIAADELICYSTSANRLQFYQNSLTAINTDVLSVFWGESFKYISNANIILEGLEGSAIPLHEKNPLIGEALFVRSFCYFHLVNLFGDIPYLTTSDYEVNAKASRTPVEEVLGNIVSDLLIARDLMPATTATAGHRVRPGRDAVTALLACLYLQQHEWQKAEELSAELIDKTGLYSLPSDLDQVFVAGSTEAI